MYMSNPLKIVVKEDLKTLRKLQRNASGLIRSRITVLIVIKQHQQRGGISKRDLSTITGANHNSIVKWRKMYLKDGIDALLSHKRVGGFKPRKLTTAQHNKLSAKLHDPNTDIIGYVELVTWIKDNLNVEIKYTTLYEYCNKHFSTKIKVARKSHIKKDDSKVESLKKTLVE
jgi:transposase